VWTKYQRDVSPVPDVISEAARDAEAEVGSVASSTPGADSDAATKSFAAHTIRWQPISGLALSALLNLELLRSWLRHGDGKSRAHDINPSDIPLAKPVVPMSFAAYYSLRLRKYWAGYFLRALKLFVGGTMSPRMMGSTGESRSCNRY
jgi:hypothetical protein